MRSIVLKKKENHQGSMRFNGFPLSAIQSAAVIWPPFASVHATAADHSINRRNLRPSAPFSLGPQSGTFSAAHKKRRSRSQSQL